MRPPKWYDKFVDPLLGLRDIIEYHFARKWLNRNFGSIVGKQEYWGDFLIDLLTSQKKPE